MGFSAFRVRSGNIRRRTRVKAHHENARAVGAQFRRKAFRVGFRALFAYQDTIKRDSPLLHFDLGEAVPLLVFIS